jgi:glutamate-1-semialdehyde 2,1-aminomutase
MQEKGDTFFAHVHRIGRAMEQGLRDAAAEAGVRAKVMGLGPLWQIVFLNDEAPDDPVIDNKRTWLAAADTDRFSSFQHEMMRRGIYFHPGAQERWFACSEHSDEHVEITLVAAREAMADVKKVHG